MAIYPLNGIRVIDAATLGAAPLVGTYLAEFGAEVIKVEQPRVGDSLREWGSKKNDVGLMWKSISRNKKCITLNLRDPLGQDTLRALVKKSDVLLVNYRPSTLEGWGLGYKQLRELNPKLVMLHVTGFGAGGPYSDRPGFGTLGEAMSGFSHVTGEENGPPTLPPVPLADGVASLSAAYGVMLALYHRDVRGAGGQLVDVNLIEPLARLLEQHVIEYEQLGVIRGRTGNKWNISVPRNTYRTKDGRWIAMSGSAPAAAMRVFSAIGRPELLKEPRFTDARLRLENADEIDRMVGEWMARNTLEDAMEVLVREEVAAMPVYDAAELFNDPHVKARRMHVSIADPDLGSMSVQGPVPRLSDTPGAVHHLGASLGQHNHEVYRDLLEMPQKQYEKLVELGVI